MSFISGTLYDANANQGIPPPLETFTGPQRTAEEVEFTCLTALCPNSYYYSTTTTTTSPNGQCNSYNSYCGLGYIEFSWKSWQKQRIIKFELDHSTTKVKPLCTWCNSVLWLKLKIKASIVLEIPRLLFHGNICRNWQREQKREMRPFSVLQYRNKSPHNR